MRLEACSTSESRVIPQQARPSLSSALWGIDWSETLPLEVTRDGVSVHASSYEESLSFVENHYALIFEEVQSGPFSNTKLSDSKMRYYRIAGDFFEFKDGATTIGLLVGTPTDWSSYYIRSAAVLPEYQGRKVIQRFFPFLFERLKEAGVERVEADTSPANMATMHLLTRLRFNVSGTILSERWGAHVHFTKFLNDIVEDAFLGRFCSGVIYQQRERVPGRSGCVSLKGDEQ